MKNRSMSIICCLLLAFLAGCQAGSVNYSADSSEQARLMVVGDSVCLDTNNGLMWQTVASQPFTSWEQARQYAEQLDVAGFNDWRLPTYDEMYILYRTVDQKRHGNCPMKLKGSFWSGNTTKEVRAGFWDSEPLCAGPTYFFVKQSSGSVIPVRSSTPPP